MAWLGDLRSIVGGPRRFFDTVKPDRTSDLFLMNMGVCAAIAFVGVLADEFIRRQGLPETAGDAVLVIVRPIAMGLGVGAGFGILTMVEILGLRLFSRRLVRPIPYRTLWAICSHAAVGWIVGAALLSAVWGTASYWHAPLNRAIKYQVPNGLTLLIPLLVAVVIGMVTFETLAFVGERRCRYANIPSDEGV
ncbi:MAG: hypothetical protein AAF108_02145 [Planctomycetota bacterium]